MATLARDASAEIGAREALDILRRIEPVLTDIQAVQRQQGESVAELKGRMSGLEGRLSQIPTIWTLASLIIAIFGFAFVLLRFASPSH